MHFPLRFDHKLLPWTDGALSPWSGSRHESVVNGAKRVITRSVSYGVSRLAVPRPIVWGQDAKFRQDNEKRSFRLKLMDPTQKVMQRDFNREEGREARNDPWKKKMHTEEISFFFFLLLIPATAEGEHVSWREWYSLGVDICYFTEFSLILRLNKYLLIFSSFII